MLNPKEVGVVEASKLGNCLVRKNTKIAGRFYKIK